MGVYARRLLATRKSAKLKQQRLLRSGDQRLTQYMHSLICMHSVHQLIRGTGADHIDKAIMNGQGRAKLAEMREQKRKMNEYVEKMSC